MKDKNLSKEVLTSSLKAFTENENHKQRLFIQFFLGTIVVIIGYSFVFSETESTAYVWQMQRQGVNFVRTSYSIVSLIGAYIVAQAVLILLARLIVSGGYSFRKYQMIVYRIRKESLGDEFHKYYGYGEDEFTPYGKNGSFSTNSYLPEFDTIFFVFIWCLQCVLLVSFIFKLGTFSNPEILAITGRKLLWHMPLLNVDVYAIKFWIMPFASIFLFFTAHFQSRYYYKYLKKVSESIPKFLNDGNLNPEFLQSENLKKYKRSTSLAWGYWGLLIFIQSVLLMFLILNKISDIPYLGRLDLIFLILLALIGWTSFNTNLAKTYKNLRIYFGNRIQSESVIPRILTEIKYNFIKRSPDAKKYRIITPIAFAFLFILIISTLILLTIGNYYNLYIFWGTLVLYIFIPIFSFRWKAPENARNAIKLAKQGEINLRPFPKGTKTT